MRDSGGTAPWQLTGLLLVLVLLLLTAGYRDSFLHVISAWNQWRSGEYYAHGYLALLISLFLLLRRRKAFGQMIPCTYLPALLPVALCSLCWLLAGATGIQLVQIAILLPLVLSAVWAVAGGRLARELVAPAVILLFALPVWSPLPPLLQALTADAVHVMVRLSDIPVLQQEQVLVLPNGSFVVEESCSGLSYLLAALTLGMLYAVLNYRGFRARLAVVLVVGSAAILANILRVFTVVVIGYRTDMKHPVIYDHFGLGWYLFGGLVLLLLLIDTRLVHARAAPARTVGPAAGDRNIPPCRYGSLIQAGTAMLCGLIAVSGPVLDRQLGTVVSDENARVPELPEGKGGWTGPLPARDNWAPVFHGAADQLRVYHKDGHKVYLYTGYYARQRQGKELIYEMNRIADGEHWQEPLQNARMLDGGRQQVLEQELHDIYGRRRLVWFWYRVAGHNTVNRYTAKVLQVLGLVSGKPQSAVFAIAAEVDADAAVVRELLANFVEHMGTSLNRVVDGQQD